MGLSFKTEVHLVETFVGRLEKTGNTKRRIILREVDCWQGRADVVEVLSNNNNYWFSEEQIRLITNYTCANIVSLLHYNAPRSKDYLYHSLGLIPRTIDKWLKLLMMSKIVEETNKDRFVLHPEFSLPPMEFSAYEVKLHDWRRALYQAIQYKGFSNQSYVVMPSKNINPAIKNLDAFVANNIGLIQVNDDGSYQVSYKPRKAKPRRRSFNIVGIGIALSRMQKLSRDLLPSEIH